MEAPAFDAPIIFPMHVFNSKRYFRQFQAADQDDLWRHLTEEARKNNIFDNTTSVKEIMDTWTLQTGFPEVTVSLDYTNRKIQLKQHRFAYADGTKKRKTDDNAEEPPLWWIPISYTTAKLLNFSNTAPTNWIRKTPSLEIDDQTLDPADWVLVNIQQTGMLK